ncbi:Yip1 family protein [Lederbergia lenta]|uniref:Yip1 domain n=1 Tax=Lederbergia lenta TaxID=1467 RepID=A0A2X4WHB4_LEDLE|nr:Yip1 family protein [Lederbergia lenta]MCM3111886.1 YIP1 family protein [Lederbergia lenta]MEC2323040.1 Yip1 family protein [Lederbergia lenta]SQI62521.1 Yip1 domain [Lederbergia lenta]
MICTSCQHEQNTGNFCGKCGNKLVDQDAEKISAETVTTATQQSAATGDHVAQPTQPNVHIEKVKDTSKKYWSYFTHYMKQPARIFENQQQEFVNGVISIGIFAFLIGIILYSFVQSVARSTFGSYGSLLMKEYAGPTFFTAFGSVFIFTIICMILVTFSLFIIGKFFGPGYTYKEIVSHYGTHLIPFILLLVISFILILLKSYVAGNALLSIVLLFSIIILPLYIVGKYLAQKSSLIDPLYAFIIYIVLFGILFSIFTGIMMDSIVGEILDDLPLF